MYGPQNRVFAQRFRAACASVLNASEASSRASVRSEGSSDSQINELVDSIAKTNKETAALKAQALAMRKDEKVEDYLSTRDPRLRGMVREPSDLMQKSTDLEKDILSLLEKVSQTSSRVALFFRDHPQEYSRLVDILVTLKEGQPTSDSEAHFVSDVKIILDDPSPSVAELHYRQQMRLVTRMCDLLPKVEVNGVTCKGVKANFPNPFPTP